MAWTVLGPMTVRKHPRWRPDWVVPPGETIKEALRERGMTQLAAAERMGISPSYLSDVVRGHRSISALYALRLETLTGISADFWAGLQAQYDVAVARREYKP
jgi:addiction module HigA family antidote